MRLFWAPLGGGRQRAAQRPAAMLRPRCSILKLKTSIRLQAALLWRGVGGTGPTQAPPYEPGSRLCRKNFRSSRPAALRGLESERVL